MARIRLTDAHVKSLRCEHGRRVAEFRDEEVTGLELRVWPSGAKTWRLQYSRRSDGKRRAVALGSYPAVGLKEARRRAKEHQAGIEDGERRADPASRAQDRRVALTFGQLADEWIKRHGEPNVSARALADARSMLARHIRPEIGAMKACDVAKRDVIALLDTVASKADARGRGVGEGRRMTHRPNRVFELVRAIFRWAVSRDLLKYDPTFGIAPPIKHERARDRELSADEIKTLWSALDAAPVQPVRARKADGSFVARGEARGFPMTKAVALALKLALATGQRIGEVTGINMAELDLNDTAPVWTIPGERSKNREPHRVPLGPLALSLIAEARALAGEDGEWLFPCAAGKDRTAGSGPMDSHAPTKALARARDKLAIDHFRVHDLRRTAATRMAEIGVNPFTIGIVLNHASVRKGTITGRVYNHYTYDREKCDALMAWDARLERIVAGASGTNVVPLAKPA